MGMAVKQHLKSPIILIPDVAVFDVWDLLVALDGKLPETLCKWASKSKAVFAGTRGSWHKTKGHSVFENVLVLDTESIEILIRAKACGSTSCESGQWKQMMIVWSFVLSATVLKKHTDLYTEMTGLWQKGDRALAFEDKTDLFKRHFQLMKYNKRV